MLRDADHVLRAAGPFAVGANRVPWVRIVRLVLLAGVVYGAVMGALGGLTLGSLYTSIKLPILLVFAVGVCLPNFYVVNAVLGLRDDFGAAVRGILFAQATLAVALCALAPVTILGYVSGASYPTALLWNGCAFALAATCGQITLARHYRLLIAKDRRHRLALAAWFVLYVFVAVKVGWVLRPFVGDPALATTFLREGKWQENPYATLFWTAVTFVWRALESFQHTVP